MKKYIEVVAVCPFVGKPCIKDGWQWDKNTANPCMFWDELSDSNAEPCLLARAVNRILKRPDFPERIETPDVPWDTEEKEG